MTFVHLYFYLYLNFQIWHSIFWFAFEIVFLLVFEFSDIAAFHILRGLLLICSGVLPSVSAPIVSSRTKSKKTQFPKDKIFSWIVHYVHQTTKSILNLSLSDWHFLTHTNTVNFLVLHGTVCEFRSSWVSKCEFEWIRRINKRSCEVVIILKAAETEPASKVHNHNINLYVSTSEQDDQEDWRIKSVPRIQLVEVS